MATLPEYLTDQTEEAIRQRMLDAMPDDLDKTEGSPPYDAIAPVAIEMTRGADWAREVRRRGFASTAASTIPGTKTAELDLRCEEHGVFRNEAVQATGTAAKNNQLTITGAVGTVIATGALRVGTPADPTTGTPSVEFDTTAACTIGPAGSVLVDIKAVVAGVSGNVPAGAISIITIPVPGVTGVTNAAPITGGVDEEDDLALLPRFLAKVQNQSAGGNRADYINWAGEVSGVGGVSVIPVRDGPGTISVAIIGTDKLPASQDLVDQVQNYIMPQWMHEVEAETMSLGGSGTSIDSTQEDDAGQSVKMEYSAAGEGTITHTSLNTILDRPGIWRLKAKIKASGISGNTDLLRIGVWNVTTGAWSKVSSVVASADAMTTLKANDLSLVFAIKTQDFYWNGTDEIELRITRLQTDLATVVWVDQVVYISTFSKDTEDGKAPAGAFVLVEPATMVLINVSAALTIAAGYNADSVKAAVQQNIDAYIKGLAFSVDNDVRYVRIGNAILDTTGVQDYANLTVNGGIINIPIGIQEVAVTGVVTLT